MSKGIKHVSNKQLLLTRPQSPFYFLFFLKARRGVDPLGGSCQAQVEASVHPLIENLSNVTKGFDCNDCRIFYPDTITLCLFVYAGMTW